MQGAGEAVETANASIAEAALSMVQPTPSIVVSSPRLSLPYQVGDVGGVEVDSGNIKSAMKSAKTKLGQHNSVMFDETIFSQDEDSISLGSQARSKSLRTTSKTFFQKITFPMKIKFATISFLETSSLTSRLRCRS